MGFPACSTDPVKRRLSMYGAFADHSPIIPDRRIRATNGGSFGRYFSQNDEGGLPSDFSYANSYSLSRDGGVVKKAVCRVKAAHCLGKPLLLGHSRKDELVGGKLGRV